MCPSHSHSKKLFTITIYDLYLLNIINYSRIELGFLNPTLRQNSTKVTSRPMQLKNREDRILDSNKWKQPELPDLK